jgi:hypothetical protein
MCCSQSLKLNLFFRMSLKLNNLLMPLQQQDGMKINSLPFFCVIRELHLSTNVITF